MKFSADFVVRQKHRAEVELTMHDGVTRSGSIYLCPQQRIVDIMNDERKFLPFEDDAGEVNVVNKSCIANIRIRDQAIDRPEPIRPAIGNAHLN